MLTDKKKNKVMIIDLEIVTGFLVLFVFVFFEILILFLAVGR